MGRHSHHGAGGASDKSVRRVGRDVGPAEACKRFGGLGRPTTDEYR